MGFRGFILTGINSPTFRIVETAFGFRFLRFGSGVWSQNSQNPKYSTGALKPKAPKPLNPPDIP